MSLVRVLSFLAGSIKILYSINISVGMIKFISIYIYKVVGSLQQLDVQQRRL